MQRCKVQTIHTTMAVRLPHRRLASLLEFASEALLATAAPAAPAPATAAALHSRHTLPHVRRFTALPAEQQPAGRRRDGIAKQQVAAGGRSQPWFSDGSATTSGSAGTAANPQTPRQQQARHAVRRPASHATQQGQRSIDPRQLRHLQPSSGHTNGGSLASRKRPWVQHPAQQTPEAVAAASPAHHQEQEYARNVRAQNAARVTAGLGASPRLVRVAADAALTSRALATTGIFTSVSDVLPCTLVACST